MYNFVNVNLFLILSRFKHKGKYQQMAIDANITLWLAREELNYFSVRRPSLDDRIWRL